MLAETFSSLHRGPGVSPLIVAGAARAVEFLLVAGLGAIVTFFYIPPAVGISPEYWIAVPGVAFATVFGLQLLGLYRLQAFRTLMMQAIKIVGVFGLVFLTLMAVVFFMKLEGVFSRGVFGLWFLTGLVALMAHRLALNLAVRAMTKRGQLDRRVAIVGGGEAAERLLEMITRSEDSDLKVCGIFDDRDDNRSPDLISGFPKLGGVDDLVTYARHTRLDLIIFAMPVTAEARILSMLKKLWVLPVDIRLAAHTQRLRFLPRNYSFIGTLPVFDMADKPFGAWDALAKTIFDRTVGALLLLGLAPLMLLVALAIKLDSRGPVLFRQKRYGFNNRLIEVFKFRSMRVEALDFSASKLVTRDDPRVTRVGRFIRRTSLDELPQLINVVFHGNLSLVGPRPHAVHAKAEHRTYDEVVEDYFARHKVKPGITGWAQVNGWRGETDTQEKIQKRVEHDLYYIENWSPLFDLTILALTPLAVLRGENAH
jgi:Undecaprenyl-phosphate glucose phosphotransferase